MENWKLKIGNWKLKLCVGIPSNCGLPLWPPGNTVQLWPPTVASHCGLPLWPPIVGGHGNTAQNCSYQFAYVFLREATGGYSWRPWEYHSQLLLINFLMFSYGKPREATRGHGNTARARPLDLNSLFLIDVRIPSSVRWLGNKKLYANYRTAFIARRIHILSKNKS